MSKLEIKINNGHPTFLVKPVWSICVSGLMERDEVYSLVSQWFGGNLKIITTVAISEWSISKESIKTIEGNEHIRLGISKIVYSTFR